MKFYVDADRIINVFEKPTSPTHFLTNQVNIENIDIDNDYESIINKVTVKD